ncbi:hypothetical protein BJ912DRAFT_1145632 [Pholiota molesta]|nr:hypothetical protein BJ912DRAFT_1145632 [Pholiota molesta]
MARLRLSSRSIGFWDSNTSGVLEAMAIASIDVRISPAIISYPLRDHEDYYDVFKELVAKASNGMPI